MWITERYRTTKKNALEANEDDDKGFFLPRWDMDGRKDNVNDVDDGKSEEEDVEFSGAVVVPRRKALKNDKRRGENIYSVENLKPVSHNENDFENR
ncbi:hypothetical protein NPIL_678101 [Nephila pilipes]|uniref:Uncharacterized protein n=1 Tax=Nephila pilipes TaxID=299642 RepID=A0A8X6JXW0_NEPPI|nr:hypothetical protein NPIL_678101 [Nephila pilipes]